MIKEVGQCVQNLLTILVAIVNIFWGDVCDDLERRIFTLNIKKIFI